jgi:hypothetical protein
LDVPASGVTYGCGGGCQEASERANREAAERLQQKEAQEHAAKEAAEREAREAQEREARKSIERQAREEEERLSRGSSPAVRCTVPALVGKSLARARRALRTAHCNLGTVRRPTTAHGRLVVVAQSVRAGRKLPNDAVIAVRLGRA